MKTLKKRVLSGAMAGVLALSLAVPAFATENNYTTNVDATFQAADIAVTVPETGVAFINPYGLDIDVKEDADDSANTNTTTISGQQIVSAPMAIKNDSKMDLKVGATVTGTIKTGSTMTFATASTKGTTDLEENDPNYIPPSTSKTAFVFLQAKTAADLTGTSVSATNVATAFAAWEPEAYDADTDIVVSARAASNDNLVSLRAATVAGTTVTYNPGSIALFRLSGDCPVSPRTPWVAADGFTAQIAFTFQVENVTKYDVTIASTTPTGITSSVAKAAAGDSVTITVPVSGLGAGDKVHFTVTTVEDTPRKLSGTVADDGASDITATFEMPNVPVTVTVTVDQTGSSDFVTT